MSPNQSVSAAHQEWADINSRVPVYVLLNIAGTKAIRTTEHKSEADKHGLYSTYPIGTYYHDDKN